MHLPEEKELFAAGAHFGHRPTNWHPKMERYIYGQKNNVQLIDLAQTRTKLAEALEFIKQVAASGGKILFVGTKVQAREIIKKYAEETGMPYVNNRWLGGTITNFKVIFGLVKKLEKLEKQAQEEDYEKKYIKKERLEFKNEMEKLASMISGTRKMENLPAAVFVASVKNEKTTVNECWRKHIPIVGICDTNANPEDVNYPIPANDDAVKSVEIITALVAEAIKEGVASAAASKPVAEAEKKSAE